MKNKIKQARELMLKAEALLKASEEMLERSQSLQDFYQQGLLFGNFKKASKLFNDIDTCERGSKRLYESYIKTLTKIQEL